MKRRIAGLALSGWVLLGFASGAVAEEKARPPVSNIAGKIVHFNRSTGVLHLQLEKGAVWIIQMQPNSKYERNQRNANSSAFHEGDMVSVGVTSSLAANPKQAVLMVDWGNSSKYVATTVTAPYTTPKGDFATTGGASSVNNVGAQRPDHTIGILGAGGKLPPPDLNNPNGTKQSTPMDPKGQAPQGLNSNPPMANSMTTRGAWTSPMQNMGIDPYSTGLPSATGLMNGGEENDQGSGMPSTSPMANASAGPPVQIQAVVVQATPGSNTMVVQQAGSNQRMNVMVGSNVNLASLRQGQSVMIVGTTSPYGFIQATQVMPIGTP